mmetsp:Transcript_72539/g.216459  ORF Transcript_72539/g.216459 Transcript_72539/m.216459 type:complete len:246 (-) Transcript_72539:123-860(-)
MGHRLAELPEEPAGRGLLEGALPEDVAEEVPAGHELHDQVEERVRLEPVIKLDHTGVLEGAEELRLAHQRHAGASAPQVLQCGELVDDLDCPDLAALPVPAELHLAEVRLPQDSAHLPTAEAAGSRRWLRRGRHCRCWRGCRSRRHRRPCRCRRRWRGCITGARGRGSIATTRRAHAAAAKVPNPRPSWPGAPAGRSSSGTPRPLGAVWACRRRARGAARRLPAMKLRRLKRFRPDRRRWARRCP